MDGDAASLTVLAPAKINLFLELIHKRDDGYHELVTVMQAIDLCDTLTVERAASAIHLQVEGEKAPAGADNLAHRAAALFWERSGVEGGVRIKLAKRIPVGAGLGGGSSDAAAVLRGLNLLLGRGYTAERLESWAAELGSDVPFFIRGGTSRCTGRGEIVTPLTVGSQPLFYCLALPALAVSTAEVYGSVAPASLEGGGVPPLSSGGPKAREATPLERALASGDVPELGKLLFNRLEAPACVLHPELKEIRDAMAAEPSCGVLMSGSGAAFYSVHETRDQAGQMKQRLDDRSLPVRALVVRTGTQS